MAERVVERTLSDGGLSIHYRLERLGGDLLLTVTGGAAHVGCVVLATHRQSLTGSGADSADSSVLNRSGHKDEFLLRALAERLSAVAGCAVAAVGGVHYDGLDQQGLRSAAHIEQQALAQAEDWAVGLLAVTGNKKHRGEVCRCGTARTGRPAGGRPGQGDRADEICG